MRNFFPVKNLILFSLFLFLLLHRTEKRIVMIRSDFGGWSLLWKLESSLAPFMIQMITAAVDDNK